MVSNGHPKHEKICVGRSTSKTVKSMIWIAISFAARRSLCYMTTKLVEVNRGLANIFGVGLRMKFSRKVTS
jgi:hypothetical protein